MSAVNLSEKSSSVIYWLCRGVFLETVRRRELSVVLLFMGLFIVGAATARFVGAGTDAAAAFIQNLGLSLAWILTLIITVLLAGRQFPDELEQRSIYPLLAKPVARYQYIAGKWLATWLAGSATALVLNLLAMAASPWPDGISLATLLQAIILEVIALSMASAIALALSIRLPKVMALVITLLLVFAGGSLVSLIQSLFAANSMRTLVVWFTNYIPNFSRLDIINEFSAGNPGLAAIDFLSRIIYGAIITAFALAAAMLLLEKKPL